MNNFIYSRFVVILSVYFLLVISCNAAEDSKHETVHNMTDMRMSSKKIQWKDPSIQISEMPATMNKQMGQVHTLNIPSMGYEMDGDVKVFKLIAQPVEWIITDGKPKKFPAVKVYEINDWIMRHNFKKKVKLWGYNGQVPGPTIEFTQGDRVRIIVKNELPEPTTVHSHGLEVPYEIDGAGEYTQKPILPGETFTYEFTVHQSGTYLYHSGFNEMKQVAMGLGGLVVIHPKDGYKRKIDVDIAIMLMGFALRAGNEYVDLVSMDFNWFTFNGKVAPDIEFIRAKPGDWVRIRFGNLSMDNHPIHLHGHVWKVVGTEGGPIPESAQWPGSTVDVPPGSVREVEFQVRSGIWSMHCHKLHHMMNSHADVPMGVMRPGGMFTVLYSPEEVKKDSSSETK